MTEVKYSADMLGDDSIEWCPGCEDEVMMTLDREDQYLRFRYFLHCAKFETDADYVGDEWVDLSNWEHTLTVG